MSTALSSPVLSPRPAPTRLSFSASRRAPVLLPSRRRPLPRLSARAEATTETVASAPAPATAAAAAAAAPEGSGPPTVILEVKDLRAVIAESRQEILKGVNLTILDGEVHAIMGKNGSGKSTLSKVLVGHPDYEVTGGSIVFKGENLLDMEPEERSHAGLFMSFQTPVEIPGVSNMSFLQMAYNARRKNRGLEPLSPIEFFGFLNPKLAAVNMDPRFLDRNVNEGFSGGEKKRNEILQLAVLEADLAILDEIDSGLDVDALQDVAKAVNGLLNKSILMITHYQRLLDYIEPTTIHIMDDGKIVYKGDREVAKLLEKHGFEYFLRHNNDNFGQNP